ncbi:tobamovirus multiplication protein 1-like isoform x1 [Anaeramoeba flamelloides]|uniref:Tobamovirus multiplication protein 1-like isoform x1 n=1 Tax=Anaeramoeba flamelloides TaxID=1746091 RepID=A0ABQ8YF36_9EUKA|nr:tobamovirus multiplication protein 1-like isoform x1 [Anaeramoeba flamelloides]
MTDTKYSPLLIVLMALYGILGLIAIVRLVLLREKYHKVTHHHIFYLFLLPGVAFRIVEFSLLYPSGSINEKDTLVQLMGVFAFYFLVPAFFTVMFHILKFQDELHSFLRERWFTRLDIILFCSVFIASVLVSTLVFAFARGALLYVETSSYLLAAIFMIIFAFRIKNSDPDPLKISVREVLLVLILCTVLYALRFPFLTIIKKYNLFEKSISYLVLILYFFFLEITPFLLIAFRVFKIPKTDFEALSSIKLIH